MAWSSKLILLEHLVGECDIAGECNVYKEERNVIEEDMRKLYGCDIERLGTLDSEKTIAIQR